MAFESSAEIEIRAPIERVWKILVDFEGYPKWNPFTPRVESTLEIGAPIVLHVRMREGRELVRVEHISAVAEPTRLCWGMCAISPRLLAAERCQILTPLDVDRTHYRSVDTIRGLLAPLVERFYGRDLDRGFGAVASALKEYAEG
jgi:uncharacterized protein YndB with AHSA1/START domain